MTDVYQSKGRIVGSDVDDYPGNNGYHVYIGQHIFRIPHFFRVLTTVCLIPSLRIAAYSVLLFKKRGHNRHYHCPEFRSGIWTPKRGRRRARPVSASQLTAASARRLCAKIVLGPFGIRLFPSFARKSENSCAGYGVNNKNNDGGNARQLEKWARSMPARENSVTSCSGCLLSCNATFRA
ncbi:hypothetical protein TESG_02981 [Trichophyton tonsurans CBS 112818]|uniref:Uncharacterized protein n=1 Tax=Trichophyton tonsurans (strain CBS 112818) TaxID=647933 RepID=F2RW03_TRIT1|nr:hypothetical protein TESG_02981 [Trichophyton tonsurans CBS 112818]